jgi:hypothetical protein
MSDKEAFYHFEEKWDEGRIVQAILKATAIFCN